MPDGWWWPEDQHPNGHLTWAEAAARLDVDAERLSRWRERGLPGDDTGIATFDLVAWSALHALDEVPAMARRWRMFLAWFRPFMHGEDHPRTIRAQRIHALVRDPQQPVTWALPRAAQGGGQTVVEDHLEGLTPVGAHHWGIAGPVVRGHLEVHRTPVRHALPDLVPVVEDLVADFRYGYRQHVPGEALGQRREGTCLDLALALGDRLTDRGRVWRPVSGVIARTALANPHFWVEVEVPGGTWAPVDPTLPVLARSFGAAYGDDWRDWVRACTGGCPPGIVILARGECPVAAPGGASVGSIGGEAVAGGLNAWPCLDWVCGDCRWTFSRSA